MTVLLYYGGSIAAGLLLGWLFVKLWRLCAPSEGNRRFWVSLGEISRQMLGVDEVALLLRLYRRLARDVGGYVLRNLGGIVLACVPVGLFLFLVAPGALALWDRGAQQVALYPSEAAWQSARTADPALASAVAEGSGRTAVCWSTTRCLMFELLAFHVVETPAPLVADAPYLAARAARGTANPLWPYLNDLEFAFACAFMLASIGGLIRRRPTAGRPALGYDKA